jgi:YD repeat-containing protein
MVAIVTGSGFGLNSTSASVLGARGQLGSASFGRFGENVTVNAATGNLMINRIDEILIGQGTDSTITRSYNSAQTNGKEWQNSAYRRITGLSGTVNTSGSTVTRIDWDGSRITYTYDTSRGCYLTKEGGGAYDTLSYSAGTNYWTWMDGDTRTVDTYDNGNSGYIKYSKNSDGKGLTFVYTGTTLNTIQVTDANGYTTEHTDFTWSGNNVSTMTTTLTNGTVVTRTRYGYDSNSRLSTVTTDLSPDNNSITDGKTVVTTYTYDDSLGISKRIASIAQTGGALLQITYDPTTLQVKTVVQTMDTGVTNTTTFTYNTNSTAITVTTPTDTTGQTTTLTYDANKQLTQIALPAAQTGATAQTLNFTYNSNGDVLTVADGSGNVTTYEYLDNNGTSNVNGNVTRIRDQAGNTITRTYDLTGAVANTNSALTNRVLTETRYFVPDPDGAGASQPSGSFTTRYAYDANGHLRFVVSPLGEVTEYTYDTTTGQQNSAIVYRGNTYNVSGLSDTTSISETALANWASGISDRSGVQRTDWAYDFRGNVQSVTTYTKASTAGAGLTTAANTVVNYVYDQYGNLLSRKTVGNSGSGVTFDGNTETFVYDGLGRITASTDLNGATTNIAFNDSSAATGVANQVVATLTATGLVRTSVYNLAGELISYVESGATGNTVYSYDALGQLRMATDATGNKTYYLYDYVGRKVADIAADGSLTEYRYDQSDRLAVSISYATRLNSTQLASLIGGGGAPTSVLLATLRPTTPNAADVWHWRFYDAADRLIQTIDGNGDVVDFAYDGASNLVSSTARAIALSATTISNLKTTPTLQTATPNAADAVTRNFYDNDSRLIGSLDANGYLSQIKYDEAGEKIETIAFTKAAAAGIRASGSFAALLTDVGTAWSDIHTRYVYDGQGVLRFTLDNDLKPTAYYYDNAGHVQHSIQFGGSIIPTTNYTASYVDNQINVYLAANANNRITWGVYDNAGRLTYSIDAAGEVIGYTYDAVGQVIKKVAYATLLSTTLDRDVTYMNNWATTNTSGNDRITRTFYDVRGRVAYTVDAENYVIQYRYDNANRLTSTIAYTGKVSSVGDSTTTATLAGLLPGTVPSDARVSRIFYDVDGRVVYTVDAEGYVTETRYDAIGRVVATIGYTAKPSSISDSTTTANLTGLLPATVPSDARLSRIFYDAAGQVVYTVDAEKYVTENKYDALGRVTSTIRYASNGYNIDDTTTTTGLTGLLPATVPSDATRTDFTYDNLGQVTTVKTWIDATNSATTYNYYNAFGNIIRTTDAGGNDTYFFYDSLGRLTYQFDAENYVTRTDYTVGNQISQVTRYAIKNTATLTAGGNVPAITTSPADQVTYFFYDKLGRRIYQLDGENYLTKTDYTIGNEISAVTHYAAKVTLTGGNLPNPIPTTPAEDAVTSFGRDKLGRLVSVTDAELKTESYELDAFGNQTKVTNKLGGVTTNTFDKRGLLTKESKAATSASPAVDNTYQYDSRGNRTQMVEANNLSEKRTTNYTYDRLNRLIERKSGDDLPITKSDLTSDGTAKPSVTYQYDSRSNLILTTDEVDAKTYFYYDRMNRKIASVNADLVLSNWAYDANGNVISQRVYDKRVTSASAGGNPPSQPSGSDYRETVYGYDHINRLISTRVGDSTVPAHTVTSGSYNGTTLAISTANLVITNTYDQNGNIIRQKDARDNYVYYYYDKRGFKVAQVDQANYLTYYTLDADGNVTLEERFANALSAAPSTSSDPAALKASIVTSVANDRFTDFTYDKNGRRLTEERRNVAYTTVNSSNGDLTQLTDKAIVRYTYNELGEVASKTEATKTSTNNEVTNYTYDVYGRQIRVKTATFKDYSGTDVTPQTDMFYDGLGNLIRTEVSAGSGTKLITTNVYGAGGRLQSSTDANGSSGLTTTYGYDKAGRVVMEKYTRTLSDNGVVAGTQVTEAKGTTYDGMGRVTSQWTATLNGSAWTPGDVRQTTYNTFGEVETTGLNGLQQEKNYYDIAGRLWKTTAGNGVIKIFYYDQNGNQTAAVTSDGTAPVGYDWSTVSLSQINTLGAFGSSGVAGMVVTYNTYDARGQNTSTVEPLRQLGTNKTVKIHKEHTYNAFGEVISDTVWRHDFTTTSPDASFATNYTYNTIGKLVQTENPSVEVTGVDGVPVTSHPLQTNYYDLSGRLVAVKDSNNNTTSRLLLGGTGYGGTEALVVKEFNPDDTFHPDGGAKTFGYDVFANQVRVTDELGNITKMTYDAMGRLTQLEHPTRVTGTSGFIEHYAYDELGRRITHWNDVYGQTKKDRTDYDVQGRVARNIDMATHTTTMSYTWSNSITTDIYGGGSLGTFGGWVENTTDPSGLTKSVTVDYFNRTIAKTDLGGGNLSNFTYNRAGQLANQTLAGNEHIEYRYYNTGQLKSVDDITTTVSAPDYGSSYTTHTGWEGVIYHPEYTYLTYQWNGSYYDPVYATSPAWTEYHYDTSYSYTVHHTGPDVPISYDSCYGATTYGPSDLVEYLSGWTAHNDTTDTTVTIKKVTTTVNDRNTSFEYDEQGNRTYEGSSINVTGDVATYTTTNSVRTVQNFSFTSDTGQYSTTAGYTYSYQVADPLTYYYYYGPQFVDDSYVVSYDSCYGSTVYGENHTGYHYVADPLTYYSYTYSYEVADGGVEYDYNSCSYVFVYYGTYHTEYGTAYAANPQTYHNEAYTYVTYSYSPQGYYTTVLLQGTNPQTYHTAYATSYSQVAHSINNVVYYQSTPSATPSGPSYAYADPAITGSITWLEDETITYDAMNRVTKIVDLGYAHAWPMTINMKYDANGNIRERSATFNPIKDDGSADAVTTQENWYKYDAMNRFVVTKGKVVGGDVVRGSTGIDLTYDLAGNRIGALSDTSDGTDRKEIYTYTADGFLADVKVSMNGATPTQLATYTLDAMGRVTKYEEYQGSSTPVYTRNAQYDEISQVTHDDTTLVNANGTYYSVTDYSYVAQSGTAVDVNGTALSVATGAYMGGVLVHSQTANTHKVTGSSTIVTDARTNYDNVYYMRDSAQMKSSTYVSDSTQSVHHDGYWETWTNSYSPTYHEAYDEVIGSASAWVSNYTYDAQGHLKQVVINDNQPRTVNYITNMMGEVMKRDVSFNSGPSPAPHEMHYYLAGMAIGDITNNGTSATDYVTQIAARTAVNSGSGFNPTVGYTTPNGYGPFAGGANTGSPYADFDQSYDPINGHDSTATATYYVIKQGDTLQSLARQLWGDANLWYLIAQANGLNATSILPVGTSIIIPNSQVHNFHNSSSTFRVYDPNLGIGDVSPTAPEIPAPPPPPPPPPAPRRRGGCGGFGAIFTAIISIAVAVILPIAAPATFAGFWGGVGAAVIGNVAGQGIGLATGIQKSFDWGSLAMTAITAGVSQGLGSSGINAFSGLTKSIGETGVAVLRGVTGSIVSQGIGVATGLQSKFDWAGVAAAGVGAGVGQVAHDWAIPQVAGAFADPHVDLAAANGIAGTARLLAIAGTRSLIDGNDFGDNIIASLPDAIGQTIGNTLADIHTFDAQAGMYGALANNLQTDVHKAQSASNRNTEKLANTLNELSLVGQSGSRSREIERALNNYLNAEAATDADKARVAAFRGDVNGRPGRVPSPDELKKGYGTTVTGYGDDVQYALSQTIDRTGVWLGNQKAQIQTNVQGFLSEHPGLGIALDVAQIGMAIANPAGFLVGQAQGELSSVAEDGVTGLYSNAGWDQANAATGGSGIVFAGNMALGAMGVMGGIANVHWSGTGGMSALEGGIPRAVIGRMPDLRAPGALRPGEYTIADKLPNLGNPKANYYQNMSVLREEMRRGVPIRDASGFRPDTELAPTPEWPNRTIRQTFTGAERNQLRNKGWTFDGEYWNPPR